MTTETIKEILGLVHVVEGTDPGPLLVIIAGTHGNETCGIKAFDALIPGLHIARGRVAFVLGNPLAIKTGVRFVDQNLNRLFRLDVDLTDTQKESYEYKRSRELMPILEAADAVLDIHSSGTKVSTPFVICRKELVPVAQRFSFPLVSYGWDYIEPGGTEDWVGRTGGAGFCIECGYHEEPVAIERAVDAINQFLALYNVIDTSEQNQTKESRKIQAISIHKTSQNFVPVRTFKDFESVVKGQVIGTDGGTEIAAPTDGVVIFVRKRQGSGEEAFIFGKED